MINITQIKETCLYVDDLDMAEAFYQGKLGMPLISKVAGRHVFFRCGTSVLLCFLPEVTKLESSLPPHYAFGKQHIAFEVSKEDYPATKREIIAAGIPITQSQTWKNGESFYFEDPFGHVLEIVPIGIWE
jgi:catechol 2,3-dioxygenase-like lactoylglutathione lyase family enzyme